MLVQVVPVVLLHFRVAEVSVHCLTLVQAAGPQLVAIGDGGWGRMVPVEGGREIGRSEGNEEGGNGKGGDGEEVGREGG